MPIFRYFILCLLLLPVLAAARDTIVELEDGSTVKVFLFQPSNEHGDGPWPLCVLMPGGDGNEYVARAQFWLGKELATRGWMIAVPVSPTNTPFTGINGQKIPKVISHLQESPEIQTGKALLVGVSTGGSSALELAAQHPEQYYGVVAVPGMMKDLSLIGDMKDLPVYLRVAEDDLFRWNEQMPALAGALRAGGARVDAALVPDARHVFQLDWDRLHPWLESLPTTEHIAPIPK